MFDKQNILKNVSKPDEKLIFSKVFDRAYYCIKNFQPTFTEFLDPYKISSLLEFFGDKYDFNIRVFGGKDNCERKKMGFFPRFMEDTDMVFPISVVEVTYNLKFSGKLTHRDFLGSVIGLGIVRGKIGDILIDEDKAFVFVDDDIADFISSNLCRVGKTKVEARTISSEEINVTENFGEIKNITSSSLRIDGILSGVFNLSRGKVSDLIKAKKAFLNQNLCESVSKQISEGDVLTLRGFGRVEVVQFAGKTRKDKFLISIRKFT